jgi:hypothetical protein
MRIRLLIDVELHSEQIGDLQDAIADQPTVILEMPVPIGMLGGRLMGAQPVQVEEDDSK